jgi:hypothetical protein
MQQLNAHVVAVGASEILRNEKSNAGRSQSTEVHRCPATGLIRGSNRQRPTQCLSELTQVHHNSEMKRFYEVCHSKSNNMFTPRHAIKRFDRFAIAIMTGELPACRLSANGGDKI